MKAKCMAAACLLAANCSAKTDNSLAGLLGNLDIFYNLDQQNKYENPNYVGSQDQQEVANDEKVSQNN